MNLGRIPSTIAKPLALTLTACIEPIISKQGFIWHIFGTLLESDPPILKMDQKI